MTDKRVRETPHPLRPDLLAKLTAREDAARIAATGGDAMQRFKDSERAVPWWAPAAARTAAKLAEGEG